MRALQRIHGYFLLTRGLHTIVVAQIQQQVVEILDVSHPQKVDVLLAGPPTPLSRYVGGKQILLYYCRME